jgi:hypothetical protein
MTPQEEFFTLYKRMAELCEEQNWGDPFSYARSKEIYAACKLGHQVATTFSGADAIMPDGTEVEYKSTTQDTIKGSYTGISVQPDWGSQLKYLAEDKIKKYPFHFYNRFEVGELAESWVLEGGVVFDILVPKLKSKYPEALTSNKKDPRLSANVTTREIKKYGKKVI